MNARKNNLFSAVLRGLGWSFFAGFLSGILAWIIDLDHLVYLIVHHIPITWKALATQADRPAHLLGFALVCLGLVVVVTLITGWVDKAME